LTRGSQREARRATLNDELVVAVCARARWAPAQHEHDLGYFDDRATRSNPRVFNARRAA